MRVAVDISICAFNRAGSARYAGALLETLQREANHAEITVVPLSLPSTLAATAAGPKRKAVTLFWELVYAPILLPRLCQRHGCDLLHTTIPTPICALPYPVVTTVHDVIPILYPQWFPPVMGRRLRRWLRVAMSHATHVIANSQNTAQDLAPFAPHVPITAIYPGSLLASPASPLPAPRGEHSYILCVGTLEPRKNLGTVLEAYRLLVEQEANVPDLLVVGAADWMASDVQEYAQRLGIAERVRLAGFVSDDELQSLYQQATMLVYPSLYEGFGFPPLEAMSNGCPVIVSNVSSLPEVVGEAGVLVEPTDAAKLAGAIHQLLSDPKRADLLRERGYAQARRFSWGRCARETISVYRQAFEGRS
ncbi:MAG TPA: glycosyltransferase family 1 protein [Ardenticatenaceae bacterium]|jgi:glycosyltransferase involved in cell wall biosynthesis